MWLSSNFESVSMVAGANFFDSSRSVSFPLFLRTGSLSFSFLFCLLSLTDIVFVCNTGHWFLPFAFFYSLLSLLQTLFVLQCPSFPCSIGLMRILPSLSAIPVAFLLIPFVAFTFLSEAQVFFMVFVAPTVEHPHSFISWLRTGYMIVSSIVSVCVIVTWIILPNALERESKLFSSGSFLSLHLAGFVALCGFLVVIAFLVFCDYVIGMKPMMCCSPTSTCS